MSRSSSVRIETSSIETGSSATTSSGPIDQGAGDDDALALAAGQLVRVAEREVGAGRRPAASSADQHPRLAVGQRVRELVDLERLGHEVVDRLLRVQRLVRVLEDELDPPAVRLAGPSSPTGPRRPCRRT